jgi:hypothetical protein
VVIVMSANEFQQGSADSPRVGQRWISWDGRDRGLIVKIGGSSTHLWLYDETDTLTLAAHRGVPVLLDPTATDDDADMAARGANYPTLF